MKILNITDSYVELSVDETELLMMNNVCNEICNGFTVEDFENKVGATWKEADVLSDQPCKTFRDLALPINQNNIFGENK